MSEPITEYVEPGFLLTASDKARYMPSRQKQMIPVVRVEALRDEVYGIRNALLSANDDDEMADAIGLVSKLLAHLEVKG